MTQDAPPDVGKRVMGSASWTLCLFAVATIGVNTLALVWIAPQIAGAFQSSNVELPALTKFVVELHPAVTLTAATVLITLTLLKEFVIPRGGVRLLLNLLVWVLIAAAALATILALFLPVVDKLYEFMTL